MMKSLQKLHEEHYKYPEYPEFYITYGYDKKNKEFKFIGYHCTKCRKVLKQKNIVPRHHQNCKSINFVPKYDFAEITEDTNVLDQNRKAWKQLDISEYQKAPKTTK